MKLEALVYSGDILALAYNRIRQIAVSNFGRTASISHGDRTALFQDAWSAVDQVHTAIQAIKALDASGPNTRAFCENFDCARKMRNGMDHLVQNIPNLAKRRGFNPPIYGSFSYCEIPPEKIVEEDSGRRLLGVDVVSLTAGYAGSDGVAVSEFRMAGPFDPPVCCFTLWAFDWKLRIDDAVRDLEALLFKLSELAHEQIVAQAKAQSEKTGAPMEQLLAEPPLSRVATCISLSFGDNGPSQRNAQES